MTTGNKLLILCIVAVTGCAMAGVGNIVAPCSACKAIATTLQDRIDNEPVRNHLDMRHRLDKDGKRYGKVIDYKVSELRAIELLDGLCGAMRTYTLVTRNTSVVDGVVMSRSNHWEAVKGAPAAGRPSREEEDVRQKQLESYCGRVLEEHEDDIVDALRGGQLEGPGATAGWLCRTLLPACPVKAAAGGKPGRRVREVVETAEEDVGKPSVSEAPAGAADGASPAGADPAPAQAEGGSPAGSAAGAGEKKEEL